MRAPALTYAPVMPSVTLATRARPGSSVMIEAVTTVEPCSGSPVAISRTAVSEPIAPATANW
nr:hypothetical protein [Fodinicola feengrottensis]